MMLTGEYPGTLDEKGRLLIPTRVRTALSSDRLVVTQGADNNLWLFVVEQWLKMTEKILGASLFNAKNRLLHRRLVAPAKECEIDRSGRLLVPPPLRQRNGIDREIYLLCMGSYMELWDKERFDSYITETDNEFEEAIQSLAEEKG